MPVGVISLATSLGEGQTCLRFPTDQEQGEISEVLRVAGRLLLTPNVDLEPFASDDADTAVFGSTGAFLQYANTALDDVLKTFETPVFSPTGRAVQSRKPD